MIGLGQEGVTWGWCNYLKYLKRGWNRKEGKGNKDFKKGGKLGQGMGALERGAGIPLQTMIVFSTQMDYLVVQASWYFLIDVFLIYTTEIRKLSSILIPAYVENLILSGLRIGHELSVHPLESLTVTSLKSACKIHFTCRFSFFPIRIFFHRHWKFIGQQVKGRDHLLFQSTTSTCSQTLKTFICNLGCEMTHIFLITRLAFPRLLLDEIYHLIELTILSIDWWCNVCLLDNLILDFCYSNLKQESSGFELVSIITLVLQANQLTKCAGHPIYLICASKVITSWLGAGQVHQHL